jgi:hypothetical protein
MKTALVVLCALVARPADQQAKVREVTVTAAAFSSDVSATAPAPDALAALQVEEAWVSFDGLGFRDAESCDQAGPPHVRGPVTVELVSGKATGLPDGIALSSTRYCGVDLALRRSRGKANDAPAAFRGASVLIIAQRADGTRVIVRSRSTQRLWLAARTEQGFTAEEGARWILGADLARWMAGIDLATADSEREGGKPVIRIDERHNRELLETFDEAFKSGLGLFHDADRDGSLQESERSGGSHLASGDASAATASTMSSVSLRSSW